jgi:uncharacterized protein YdhG (YjbR/CyaY superfamily)
MKKAKSSKQSPASKRKSTPKSVDEYLARVPKAARAPLTELRAAIRATVPRDAEEVISYGIPAFRRKRILVWYAAFAKHCSLFPSNSVIVAFKDQLQGLKISKGTIQFPLDKPLPISLIKRIVKARVAEAEPQE